MTAGCDKGVWRIEVMELDAPSGPQVKASRGKSIPVSGRGTNQPGSEAIVQAADRRIRPVIRNGGNPESAGFGH